MAIHIIPHEIEHFRLDTDHGKTNSHPDLTDNFWNNKEQIKKIMTLNYNDRVRSIFNNINTKDNFILTWIEEIKSIE